MKTIIKNSLISVATCAVLMSLQGCGKDRAGISSDDPRALGGLSTTGERSGNCGPGTADEDCDWIPDALEGAAPYANAQPNNNDTDNDGLADGCEYGVAEAINDVPSCAPFATNPTNPNNPDSDGDTISDPDEAVNGYTVPTIGTVKTNPNLKDTDGDGIDDNVEKNSYPVTGIGQRYSNPTLKDTDGDLLSDGIEKDNALTDPRNVDTDGDYVNDGIEVCGTTTFATTRDNGEIKKVNSGDVTSQSNGFYDDTLTGSVVNYDNLRNCGTPAKTNNITDALTPSNDSDGDERPNDKEHTDQTDPLHAGHEPGATPTEATADIADKYYSGWITQKEPGKTLIANGFVYVPKDANNPGYWMAKYEAVRTGNNPNATTVVFDLAASNTINKVANADKGTAEQLISNTSPISGKAIALPTSNQYVQLKNVNDGFDQADSCLKLKNNNSDTEVSSSYTDKVCELQLNDEYVNAVNTVHDENTLGKTDKIKGNQGVAFRAAASK